ncbi:MAG: hypothetical protein IMHGJWDQ_000634 [Candidatus Fervidibacter sp.]
MRRDGRWVVLVCGARWWLTSVLLCVLCGGGWAQATSNAPMVVFLEPSDGTTLPADIDSVQIRFRLISPDNTNLMRYQPFVNGLPGNEPIPIDPPSPQVELTILWRGIKQFPDGAHTITIKVVDAKGREGSGTLTLYKGRDIAKPTAEILQPRSGEVARGKVPILVRVTDDRGIRSITVNATQRDTAQTHTLHMALGNFPRLMEVRVIWDTTAKHPGTMEDLFPDGIYLLQARVRDQEGNEGVSSEVLVIVQNKVAQPLISQVTPMQPARGGALPPVIPLPQGQAFAPQVALTLPALLEPSATHILRPDLSAQPVEGTPQMALAAQTRPFPPASEGAPMAVGRERSMTCPAAPMKVAMVTPSGGSRLPLALPPALGQGAKTGQEVILSRSEVPLPQAVGVVSSAPPSTLQMTYAESTGQSVVTERQWQMPEEAVPQVATISRLPLGIPMGQERRMAWLPPAPRTLQRAPEVSETPAVAIPLPAPRLKAPQEPARVARPLPVRIQPVHSFRYTAIAGDTLYSLAERFGLTVKELAAANGLPENAPLRVGQRLVIPARPVKVLVDGKPAECEVPAFVRAERTVGSFRAVVEASGGIVGWEHELKRATAQVGTSSIAATIGRSELEVNGERVPLSIAPFLLRNRTFLPLRELGKALGKTVQWEGGILRLVSPRK